MRILDFADGFESSSAPSSVSFPASTVSVTPSGNLSSTTAQTALQELQGDIDTINAKVGAVNGIASLDSNGQIPSSQIPAIAIVTVYSVANIAARNALTVQSGDVAIVADNGSGISEDYMYDGTTWKLLSSNASVAAHAATTTGVHGITGNVVGTSDTQVLTNKDIDGGTASNTNRITLPKGPKTTLDTLTRKAGTIVFDTTSGKPYYDDGSTLQLVGSGSGGGSKNYITGGDAESGVIGTGYADGSAIPTANVAGSPTAALTVSSTNPLSQTNSFVYTPGALGNGRAFSFTIDREDAAKLHEIEVSYEIGGTGYADGDLQLWVVCPSGAVLQPSSYKILNASGPAKVKAVFQTESVSSGFNYKIKLHQTTATSTYTVKFEIKCGPQVTTTGAFIGDWQSFTPTGTWTTNTTYTGKWRRVGDSMEVQTLVSVSGAPNAAALNVNLPSGYSIDSTKVVGTSPDISYLGGGSALDAGVQNYSPLKIGYASATSVAVYIPIASGTYTTGTFVNATTPFAFGSGDFVSITYSVPIQGWGTSQVLSSDSSEGRVVALRVGSTPSGTLNSSFNQTTFPTVANDTHGGYSSGVYTVKVPGFYDIAAGVSVTGASIAQGNFVGIQIQKNGAPVATNMTRAGFASVNATQPTEVAIDSVFCNVGDQIRVCTSSTYTTPSYAALLDGTEFFFTLAMRSGNQQVSASESVNCRVGSSATTLTNSTTVKLAFTAVQKDTHSRWSTDTYICPLPGMYRVYLSVELSSFAAGSVGATLQGCVFKNGSQYSQKTESAKTTTSVIHSVAVSDEIPCNAGDTLDFRIFHTLGATPTINNNSITTYATITRVGN